MSRCPCELFSTTQRVLHEQNLISEGCFGVVLLPFTCVAAWCHSRGIDLFRVLSCALSLSFVAAESRVFRDDHFCVAIADYRRVSEVPVGLGLAPCCVHRTERRPLGLSSTLAFWDNAHGNFSRSSGSCCHIESLSRCCCKTECHDVAA